MFINPKRLSLERIYLNGKSQFWEYVLATKLFLKNWAVMLKKQRVENLV